MHNNQNWVSHINFYSPYVWVHVNIWQNISWYSETPISYLVLYSTSHPHGEYEWYMNKVRILITLNESKACARMVCHNKKSLLLIFTFWYILCFANPLNYRHGRMNISWTTSSCSTRMSYSHLESPLHYKNAWQRMQSRLWHGSYAFLRKPISKRYTLKHDRDACPAS